MFDRRFALSSLLFVLGLGFYFDEVRLRGVRDLSEKSNIAMMAAGVAPPNTSHLYHQHNIKISLLCLTASVLIFGYSTTSLRLESKR